MTEGYIKFNCIWDRKEIQFQDEIYTQLEAARTKLYSLDLIGTYPDGIGFGNISVRNGNGESFIITGSATGGFESLKQSDYALVTNYNINENAIFCTGLTQASSESLSHAAVYKLLPDVGAVVHVHCLWLWKKLLNIYPATSVKIEYGTPEMAYAVGELALKIEEKEKIIVMGGHQEGIIAFAQNLNEATSLIINIYNLYKHD